MATKPLDSRRFSEDLSEKQKVLFLKLHAAKTDVPIETLFKLLYPTRKEMKMAQQQRALGSHFFRLNTKLAEYGRVIRPGVSRRSYRLWPVSVLAKVKRPAATNKPVAKLTLKPR